MARRHMLLLLGLACVREEAQHKAAGNVLFRQGDVSGALREYETAVKTDSGDFEAYVLRGNALFELERYDEAAASFRQALSITGKASAAHRGLAKVALKLDRLADAERHYGDLISAEPQDFEALRELSVLKLGRGDLKAAEALLLRARSAVGNDARTLFTLAIVQARSGATEAALQTAVELERLEPRRGFGAYAKATALALAGRSEEALSSLENAIRLGVDDLGSVARDPNLASLRGHARFSALTRPSP